MMGGAPGLHTFIQQRGCLGAAGFCVGRVGTRGAVFLAAPRPADHGRVAVEHGGKGEPGEEMIEPVPVAE